MAGVIDVRTRPRDAVVVVPARDEEARIAACLEALAAQTVGIDAFELIVVLDACADDTEAAAAAAAAALHISLTMIVGPGLGSGPARRAGMELACDRLLATGRPDGLIATTDADSRPAPDWLARQLVHVRAGARVVAGLIELDDEEARLLPAIVLAARERDAATRLRRVRRTDPDAAHHHFAGASLGVTARAYRAVGGIEPLQALEDDGFARRLAEHRVPVLRAPDVTVTTSARVDGRASQGLSADLAVARWCARRRFGVGEFSVAGVRAVKGSGSVVVVVPVKECAQTIAGVLEVSVAPLVAAGVVDEVVVVDAASGDGSAGVAAAHGARVLQQDALVAGLGPALGKGDAMWRAVQACQGDVICFLDGDTRDPSPDHLLGLLGPVLGDGSVMLVKGAFDRPLDTGAGPVEHEGGRVTELMARPAINLYEPLLAGFTQPLAGEFAARREVLEAVAFPVGYGVEIAILIDALRGWGLDALAECHLGTRQNRHQPLRALGEMAYAVLAAIETRRPAVGPGARPEPSGRYLRPWQDPTPTQVPTLERPPIHPRARTATPLSH